MQQFIPQRFLELQVIEEDIQRARKKLIKRHFLKRDVARAVWPKSWDRVVLQRGFFQEAPNL